MFHSCCHYVALDLDFFFFVVLAEAVNARAVGAPADPGVRIFSPDPALMRFFFACMFAYNPGLLIIFYP